MENIEKAFTDYFAHWDIRLPPEAMESKQQGKILEAGWIVEYLFGVDEGVEYLDFYAVHRMTDDRHERVYTDGRHESLETPMEMYGYPGDADEATKQRAMDEYHAHNREVYERLRKKGFLKRES